jgi:hypothetical protein
MIAARTVLESEESLAGAVHRTVDSHGVTQIFDRASGERLALIWDHDYEYTVAGQRRLSTDVQAGRWPRALAGRA